MEVRIESVRKIMIGRRNWGEMAVVKLGNEEEKRKVMKNKRKLKRGYNLAGRRSNMVGKEN